MGRAKTASVDDPQVEEQTITTTPSLVECQAIITDHGLEQPTVMFMPATTDKVCVVAVFKDGRSGVVLDIPEVDLHDNMAEVWRIHAMGPHGPHE